MKLFIAISLSLFLVACGQAVVQEPVTPPVVTTPEPEMMAPVEETPVYEDSEPVVDEEPAMEEPVEEEPVEEEPVEEEPVEEEPVEEEPVEEEPVQEETSQTRVFNAQTLAQFNGRDGQPTYVAIDGLVYDLSTSTRWVNGNHNGFQAGQDLSRQIPQNHRADMRFERFPVVGTYE